MTLSPPKVFYFELCYTRPTDQFGLVGWCFEKFKIDRFCNKISNAHKSSRKTQNLEKPKVTKTDNLECLKVGISAFFRDFQPSRFCFFEILLQCLFSYYWFHYSHLLFLLIDHAFVLTSHLIFSHTFQTILTTKNRPSTVLRSFHHLFPKIFVQKGDTQMNTQQFFFLVIKWTKVPLNLLMGSEGIPCCVSC